MAWTVKKTVWKNCDWSLQLPCGWRKRNRGCWWCDPARVCCIPATRSCDKRGWTGNWWLRQCCRRGGAVCHYRGHVEGYEENSVVAMNRCGASSNHRATVFLDGRVYQLDPAGQHADVDAGEHTHVMFDLEHDRRTHGTFRCDVSEEGKSHDVVRELAEELFSTTPGTRELQQASQKYLELLVVNDKVRFDEYNGQPEKDSVDIVNVVSALYESAAFKPPVQVVLKTQVTFDSEDPWAAAIVLGDCADCTAEEVAVDVLLSNFNQWRSDPTKAPLHDNGQLFSGYDFSGFTLGYAPVGSVCENPRSGGIDMANKKQATAFTGAVVSHEMGHNFGMSHDSSSNTCPESGFVMNAVVGSVAPTQFSVCSRAYLAAYLENGLKTCIDNKPTVVWGDKVCGNGFVETGEDCDCGDEVSCELTSNPCCNATSCKLLDSAQCSEIDGCCENCRIVRDRSQVCRTATTDCDLAETCDGRTSTCPADLFKGAGVKCTIEAVGAGLCHKGVCYSHLKQCRAEGDVSGRVDGPFDECPYNSHVTINGWDGTGGDELKREFFCSVLWCRSATDPDTCTFFRQSSQVVAVQDGVPCGANGVDDEYQCFSGQCTSSSVLSSNFAWQSGDWSNCRACGTEQTRTAQCVDSQSKRVNSDFCSPADKPLLNRQCINETLGCEYADSAAQGGIDLFGVAMSENTVMFAFLGFISFALIILACCYHATTFGDGFKRLPPEGKGGH